MEQLMRIVVALVMAASWAPATAAEPVDYPRQIKPLLARRCYACHGALKQQAGLRLDTAAAAIQGGRAGAAIDPGFSDASLLIDAVTGSNGARRMPPKDQGEPFSPEEVSLLRAWIDQGALAPADERPQPDPRAHWSFQRIERPAVPPVRNAAWVANPIDAFIAAEHERHGLSPNPPADKSTLLRRVHLDLTGLPPTREQLRAFLNDHAPDAYERVVDRLLDSPQYGERWARHWMDVWRYSDWYGRRSVPDVWNSAPQVWRWRDWIVQSLNADKGYDRMLMEMLAADEIAPEDDEGAVATGYIIRNWYALNPNQWMRDLVEHTGKAFLGLTFNCAHCHDHKYDPISQEEYFRFRAFFEPVQVRQDRLPAEPDCGPFQKYQYGVLRKIIHQGAVRVFDENLAAETFMYRLGDERDRFADKPPVVPGAPAFLGGEKLKIAAVSLPDRASYPGLKRFIREAETAERALALQKARAAVPAAQQALVAALTRQAEVEAQHLAAIQSAPPNGTQPQPFDPRLLDRKAAARSAVKVAQHAAQLAEKRLAAEQALGESLAARIAADVARFDVPGASRDTIDAVSKAASFAERTANLCSAEEKHLVAVEAAETARRNADAAPGNEKLMAAVQTAETQLTAATKALNEARQALTSDSATYSPLSPVYPSQSTGRRKALAEWIARRDNPLTARVAVNHIWLRHFGRALVDSVSDFGVNGKRPSHPELLDWLAMELMEPTAPPPLKKGEQGGAGPTATAVAAAGVAIADLGLRNVDSNFRNPKSAIRNPQSGGLWRMKSLHRLIVTSSTYRQASPAGTANPNLAADPDNRWIWRFSSRRVESEALRDSLLFASGQLDLKLGGRPFENTEELKSRRRSLYFSVHPEDGGQPKFLELFDAPDPCDCYKRSESMIPQQALAMTNSELTLIQSRLLGRKLWEEALATEPDDAKRQAAAVTAAFEGILSRAPTPAEVATCLEFLQRQSELFRKSEQSPPTAAAQGAVVPSTEPMIRACASLVHALFSHHEFVTLR